MRSCELWGALSSAAVMPQPAARAPLRLFSRPTPLLLGLLAAAASALLGVAAVPCPVPSEAIVASLPPAQQLQSACKNQPPSQCPRDCLCTVGQTFIQASALVGYSTLGVTKDQLQGCILENLSPLLDRGLQLNDLLPVRDVCSAPKGMVSTSALLHSMAHTSAARSTLRPLLLSPDDFILHAAANLQLHAGFGAAVPPSSEPTSTAQARRRSRTLQQASDASPVLSNETGVPKRDRRACVT